jgi:hypothetical protein
MTGSAARFLANETRTAVTEEVGSLGEVYRRGGLRVLVREIDRRSRRPGANLYMIADNSGRILSGNVIALQPGVLDTRGLDANAVRLCAFRRRRLDVIDKPEDRAARAGPGDRRQQRHAHSRRPRSRRAAAFPRNCPAGVDHRAWLHGRRRLS